MVVVRFVLVLSVVFSLAQSAPVLTPDPPIACGDCASWNGARDPFRVFGNTYFVGTNGLSSVLVTSDEGHVLLDGALPQSAPVIDANIRKLGFRTQDIRLIVNSHEHFDHAGGIAALQRASGGIVAASGPAAAALERGAPTPEDPQPTTSRFPRLRNVKRIRDGETLRVGPIAITAHLTPGHTPGATTWTWRSCEGSSCLDVVYADSLTPVSDDGFRFTGNAARPSRVEEFRKSLTKLEQLPCDVMLVPHPFAMAADTKLEAGKRDRARNPFIDRNACRDYAAAQRKRLEARIASEKP